MYTTNAAYAAAAEDIKGSLEIGKLADIVVIDRDPYDYPDSRELYDMKVLYTIKNGEVIFEA